MAKRGLHTDLDKDDSEGSDEVSEQVFLSQDISRDDLTELYRIVMNRYGKDGPEDELEKSTMDMHLSGGQRTDYSRVVMANWGCREEEVEDPVMAIWRQNRTFNVIIRMDWLSECDAVIVCGPKVYRKRVPVVSSTSDIEGASREVIGRCAYHS
ncbi:hypothetical protein Tco_0267629 [Tanacetum coccineum]